MTMQGVIRLAWWNLRGRRARITLLVVCLALAVTGRVGIGTLVAGVERSAAREARGLLGGDLELTSSRPLSEEEQAALATSLPTEARQMAVEGLVTMVVSGQAAAVQARPIELRAVPDGYPLVGRLDASAPAAELAAGAALVQPELLTQLGIHIGDEVRLGSVTVRIAGVIRDEPGLSVSPFSAGPRVLVGQATLKNSGLAAHGARIRYVTLIALPDATTAKDTARALKLALGQDPDSQPPPGSMGPPQNGVSVRTAEDAQAQAGRFLERFADYVRLAALVALLLGGVGVASLVRGQVMESLDDVAVLRVVGASSRQVQAIFLIQAVYVGLLGGAVGTVVGAGSAAALAAAMPSWGLIPRLEPVVLLSGVALGTATAAIFALLPLAELALVTPLAILRREHLTQPRRVAWGGVGGALLIIISGLMLLAAWDSRSWQTGPALMGTVLMSTAVLYGIARVLLPLLSRVRPGLPWLNLAFGNLGRPGYRPVAAVTAIGLATFLIGMLLIYRTSFLAELDPSRSGGVPSLFVIDLQVDQIDDFRAFLTSEGLDPAETMLAPMVRARYRDAHEGSGDAEKSTTREAEQARFFRNREQNLSWRDELGIGNTITSGRWMDPHGLTIEASLEERYATRLGVKLGEPVTFDVQGVSVTATVTSLRRVDWATFRPNFFVLLTPSALHDAPQTWIASLPTLPDGQRQGVQARLAEKFPGATAFDVTEVGRKVVALIERLVWTIRVIATLSFGAGLAVLIGMALATAATRRADHALLLVLGARRRLLMWAIASEFAVIGLLAGGLGASLAAAASWVVIGQVIGLELTLPWGILGGLVGMVGLASAGIGSLASRGAWQVSPLAVLRDE